MKEKNMTALVSAFARAYHSKNYKYKIFNDYLAEKILTEREYIIISEYLSNGIKFFNPKFNGTKEEALRYIIDNNISPSILARSIYVEDMLLNARKLGIKQYIIYASGYDTYAYRNNYFNVFEIDKKEMVNDKIKRLKSSNIDYSKVKYIDANLSKNNWPKKLLKSNYNSKELSISSLLGITYYLTKKEFNNLLKEISKNIIEGSTIIFDYPTNNEKDKELLNKKLASGASEEMKLTYSHKELEKILFDNNFLIYENLTSKDINNNYFYNYNTLNPNHKIYAPIGVNYCLAVKK